MMENVLNCNNNALFSCYRFNLRNEMLGMWPALLYVLVAGALSDRFGRKPLLLLPMLGSIVEMAVFLAGHWLFYQAKQK